MGNAIYGNRLSCYETVEICAQACARFECVYVDKCDGGSSLHYVCLPFDTRFFMWLLVGLFLLVVLSCSAIVVCYAIRAIRASFRHALVTENDIVFYNSANVHTFPHPAIYSNSNQTQYYSNNPVHQNHEARQPATRSTSSFSGFGVVPYPTKNGQQQK